MPGDQHSYACKCRPGAKDVWQKTKAEEKAGIVGALRQTHELDLSKVLLVRRFGVETWSSQQGRKVRNIDDFAANEVNEYAVSYEASRHDREDVLSATINRLQKELAGRQMCEGVEVGLEDFVGAYKTLAPDSSQTWMMMCLVWDTDEGVWRAGEMYTLPFGAVGSVLAWYRVSAAHKAILRRLFEVSSIIM